MKFEPDESWDDAPEIPAEPPGIPWVHLALGTVAGLATFFPLHVGLDLPLALSAWLAAMVHFLVFCTAEAFFDPHMSWMRRKYPAWSVVIILGLSVLGPTLLLGLTWAVVAMGRGFTHLIS